MRSDFQEYLHNHGKVINLVPSNGLGYTNQDIIMLASVLCQVCPQASGALRTGSRDSEAVLWQTLNQFYDK